MSTTSWLDALKETLEEKPRSASRSPREDLRDPIPSAVQNVQKSQEETAELPSAPVVGIRTARTSREEDERRQQLLAAGWKPKERQGLIIWERPDNGFYVSEEMALHNVNQGLGASNEPQPDGGDKMVPDASKSG